MPLMMGASYKHMSHEIAPVPIGYDYGLKPRLMLVGNTEFPALLSKPLLAVAYGRMPDVGGLIELPFLGFLFDTTQNARHCFGIFKEWVDAAKDGDAVCINFIEFKNGDYGICISPRMEDMIERLVPPHQREEVDPLAFLVGHLKTFSQQSQGYKYFRDKASKSRFLVTAETQHGSLNEFNFRKRQVNFWKEDEVPEDSVEFGLLQARNGSSERESRSLPPSAKMSREEVAERRKRQVSRFFPVTLEKIRLQPKWSDTRATLEAEGFKAWQIEQAVCNVSFRQRVPELFTPSPRGETGEGESPTPIDVLDYLLNTPESIGIKIDAVKVFDAQVLRQQMALDAAWLINYFQESKPASPDKILTPQEAQCDLGRLELLAE